LQECLHMLQEISCKCYEVTDFCFFVISMAITQIAFSGNGSGDEEFLALHGGNTTTVLQF